MVDRDPEPLPYDEARAREVVGSYENDAMTLTIATDGAGLTLEVGMKPEIRAALDTDAPPDYPPADIGLLPGDGDEYIVTEGGLKGQRGFFTRDESGAVVGVDLAGRLFTRVPADTVTPRSCGADLEIRRFGHDRRTGSGGRSSRVHRRGVAWLGEHRTE